MSNVPDGDEIVFVNSPTSVATGQRLSNLWSYRELLANLTRRELKVRYKNSVLGFLWTLLNPLLYLLVFTIVFSVILPNPVQDYGIFLLCGLLAWNLFSVGLTSATSSIVANGPLVQKVWFPREILPLSAVGAAAVNFCFQFIVLATGLVVLRRVPDWRLVVLVVPALFITILLATGLGLLLSSVNVLLRDTQHFLELGLLTWFWLTPIVYQFDFVADVLVERFGSGGVRLAMLNPMVPVVTTMQAALYNPRGQGSPESKAAFDQLDQPFSWFAGNLAISFVIAVVIFLLSIRVFAKLEANLGEEI